jgi:hypothetical protein
MGSPRWPRQGSSKPWFREPWFRERPVTGVDRDGRLIARLEFAFCDRCSRSQFPAIASPGAILRSGNGTYLNASIGWYFPQSTGEFPSPWILLVFVDHWVLLSGRMEALPG